MTPSLNDVTTDKSSTRDSREPDATGFPIILRTASCELAGRVECTDNKKAPLARNDAAKNGWYLLPEYTIPINICVNVNMKQHARPGEPLVRGWRP